MIEGVGEALPREARRDDAPTIDGCTTVFPVKADGTEMVWGLTRPSLLNAIGNGFVRVSSGSHPLQPYTISYLRGIDKNLASGRYRVTGERSDGSKVVVLADGSTSRATTAWRDKAHDAGAYGTTVLRALIPGRHFPFPKSLYAVEDAVRVAVGAKPDAVVLDFFAGSGTTAHAVARLNRQDGGRRQAIVVTNNEVSVDEGKTLSQRGLRDGDSEWESLGIFEYITRPRITAAVTGITSAGDPVTGHYKFVDEFPMAEGFNENVEFLKLTYQDPLAVELDTAFEAVAPLLWLRAGGQGPIIETRSAAWDVTGRYGILFDPDQWRPFLDALTDSVRTVFVVTDSDSVFTGVAGAIRGDVDVVRLYENYLSTFTINRAG